VKKLAKLDIRIQLGLVAVGLILLGFVGHMFLVSPQGVKAAKLQKQIDDEQVQIVRKRAELRAGQHPPAIQVADIFKLSRAMPDREDMPGMLLTLSDVAKASGISFDLVEPVDSSQLIASGTYHIDRIHVEFKGDFYALSDFLYRLRNLVVVRDGKLAANGRLFNVQSVSFTAGGDTFPQITAELFVDAYEYGTATVPAPAAPTTTTPPTDSSSSDVPTGASAVGATG
jgi:Tfp pilus assembly protein PilO